MKKLGDITIEESKRVLELYEKKMAIDNLVKILDPVKEEKNYTRAVEEQKESNEQYDLWWTEMYDKYQWEGIDVSKVQDIYIDFRKNAIFLQ